MIEAVIWLNNQSVRDAGAGLPVKVEAHDLRGSTNMGGIIGCKQFFV